jgi:hypothetical protein
MGCRLDFLSYQYGSSTPLVESDGELTVEFAEMERYANLAATSNTVNDYWCALAARPELFCLDIAGPSTLSNSLNTTAFDLLSDTVFSNGEFILDTYKTTANASINLFGQYDQCDGKVVGDGLINVFDIATMIAYIFKDYKYADLDPNPEKVVTVEGRDRLQLQCDVPVTRAEYLSSYATDTCVFFDDGCHGNLRWTTGCANPDSEGMNRTNHMYELTLSAQTKREICAFECERRNCVNFEIKDAQCLTYMAECTDAELTSEDLQEVYKGTYSCNHDYLPTPPPPSPAPPAFPPPGRRRLSSDDNKARRLLQSLTPITAQTLWSRWQSTPLLTPQDYPMTARSWLPAIGTRYDVTNVPARQLSVAQHTIYPDYDHSNGRWYTLRTASVSLRLHAVLTGLPGVQKNTKLSYRRYDGTPPDDPTQQEVRYTRLCEFGQCDFTCASIETAHPSRVAMHYSTLELVQRPIVDACPFETHIWVPYRYASDDRCVGVEYLMIGDGVRGQFARDTACTRNLLSPPPPTPVGLPRPPPFPRPPPAPVVSFVPPPPPNASLSFPPPPPADPPAVDKSWVWIVSVVVLVLGSGCGCVALVVTHRSRFNRDKDTVVRVMGIEAGLGPSITRAMGLGSSNSNPIKPRSDGHMTQRRGTEPKVVAPPSVQPNRHPTPSIISARDGTGLGGRRVSRPIGASTIAPNRHNMPSTNVDGTGLGRRRAPPPPIG